MEYQLINFKFKIMRAFFLLLLLTLLFSSLAIEFRTSGERKLYPQNDYNKVRAEIYESIKEISKYSDDDNFIKSFRLLDNHQFYSMVYRTDQVWLPNKTNLFVESVPQINMLVNDDQNSKAIARYVKFKEKEYKCTVRPCRKSHTIKTTETNEPFQGKITWKHHMVTCNGYDNVEIYYLTLDEYISARKYNEG